MLHALKEIPPPFPLNFDLPEKVCGQKRRFRRDASPNRCTGFQAQRKKLYFEWSPPWHFKACNYSDIYSENLSHILSGIYSGIVSGIGDPFAPELAVRVRPGTLRSSACGWGLVGNTLILSLLFGSGGETLWSWVCCPGAAGNTAI